MSVLDRLWGPSEPIPQPDLGSLDADPLDDVLNVLSNSRRRMVVILLDEGAQRLDEMAEEIATIEVGPDFDSKARKAVYVGLYQTHLHVLADHGVIDGGWKTEAAIGRSLERYRVTPGPNHALAVNALAAVQDVVADDGGIA